MNMNMHNARGIFYERPLKFGISGPYGDRSNTYIYYLILNALDWTVLFEWKY